MSKLFSQPQQPQQTTQRSAYEMKYKTSRMNLLILVIATAVNLVLLVTNSNSYFLFSAYIPYFITSMGMYLCGLFPEDYYQGELPVFNNNIVFIVLLAIAIVITLFYLLTYFMSNKNRSGWLVVALVFFSIDTLGMIALGGINAEAIIDVLFHAWVIYYLVLGIGANKKLKNLPPEEVAVEAQQEAQTAEAAEPVESTPLRKADAEVKHRVLLEKRMLKYDICYRRVKHTNELVVNGDVYAELEGIIEQPHTLCATIDGHNIAVGTNNASRSFIMFDGEVVEQKIRLI